MAGAGYMVLFVAFCLHAIEQAVSLLPIPILTGHVDALTSSAVA